MQSSNNSSFDFSIRTEVAPVYYENLLLFISNEYVRRNLTRFFNHRRWNYDGEKVLAFSVKPLNDLWNLEVEITAGETVKVKMVPEGTVPSKIIERLREDLIIAIQIFEEKIRKNTLYFAWVPNKEEVPEKSSNNKRKIIREIFMGNMFVLFMIFILISYGGFLLLTEVFGLPILYFPLVLVITQFVTVLFSHKIVARMGDWPITAMNPYVYILQYHAPPWQFEHLRKNLGRNNLLQIKKEIFDKTISIGKHLGKEVAYEVFLNHGITINSENILTKKINVYNLVKEAANKFRIPTPKIILSNIIIPNAAATGPTPRFGLVLLTTGLLVQLEEDEILAVIGHEMSHVGRRDPISLFVLVSAEYLFRVYLLWNYIYLFGLFYFIFSLGIIYFIAKFFEARADLDSALVMGNPEILADALRKIGYRKIQIERLQSSRAGGRIGAWIGLNPHPPYLSE